MYIYIYIYIFALFQLVSVSVQTDVSLCRGGSVSPNAVVNIWSVAVFDAERNPGYTKQMYDFLLPELNMPADRSVALDINITNTSGYQLKV